MKRYQERKGGKALPNMKYSENTGLDILCAVLKITIVVSVFSQIKPLEPYLRPSMYLCWLLLIVLTVIQQSMVIKVSSFTRYFALVFAAYLFFCSLCAIWGTAHMESNYLRLLMIPLMVVLVSDGISKYINIKQLSSAAKWYILSAFVFAAWVHVTYFSSFSEWLGAEVYLYSQKNSAAQIWGTSILLILFLVRPRRIADKIFWWGIAAYLLAITGLSQCRTALLALAVSIGLVLFFKVKHRWMMGLGVAGMSVMAYKNPKISRIINQVFLINKYAGTDMDTFSSGRLNYIAQAWEAFQKSPLIGAGSWYVDCSYVNVLAESGIIGFALIESVWLYRIYLNFKASQKGMRECVAALTVFYCVESLLEGYPPFGPGVTSFMFWLLSEYSCQMKQEAVNAFA